MKIALPHHELIEIGNLAALSQNIPWSIADLNIPTAWQSARGEGVTAIVLDTGFSGHPDNCHEVRGPSFVPGEDCDDLNGHGSHVAGIIGACDNMGGIVGVAPEAQIISVKTLGKSGTGSDIGIAKALEWAIEQSPDVINLSLGNTRPLSERVYNALVALHQKGIPIVAAGGNFGPKAGVLYPAKWPMTLGIAAYDVQEQTADFSAAGPEIDFAAPGVNILSTYKDGQYATMSGTSMAAPFVTGLICLLLSNAKRNNVKFTSVGHIKQTLVQYTRDAGDPGKDDLYGFGIIEPTNLSSVNIIPPDVSGNNFEWTPPLPPVKQGFIASILATIYSWFNWG